MGTNPSKFKNAGPGAPVEFVSYDNICGVNRPWPLRTSVTDDSFLGRLRARTKLQTFDLPTEAQWEYACRAGTITAFSFGNECNGTQCNCNGNYPDGTWVIGPLLKSTPTVGNYPPNSWGLYDMHGNVWEWCADWYGDYRGDEINPIGANTGTIRVSRGGCFYSQAKRCRSSYRKMYYAPKERRNRLGFRLVYVPMDETD